MHSHKFLPEAKVRYNKMLEALRATDADAMLLNTNVNLYYTAGRVFSGYVYLTIEGKIFFFVKRPVGLQGEYVTYVRKPEDIPALIEQAGLAKPKRIALELDFTSYSEISRLMNLFPEATTANASAIMRNVRATKTSYEIAEIRTSGAHHEAAYRRIVGLYREGMTDVELQIEIEHCLRLEGCLGIFRVAGPSMEVFMGSLLSGDNADAPSPYDFALGGAGQDDSLPVGCNGTLIRRGMSVMVDLCGNFTGYMTDMSRTFAVGQLSELAQKAHDTSRAIHKAIIEMSRPGTPAADLYNKAKEIATEAGLSEYFMGHRQQAGFIGHGVGIEINEAPVLAPRSRDILAVGNVIAVEPKFVIPGTGAVGVENTYVMNENGLECLTCAPEEILRLD